MSSKITVCGSQISTQDIEKEVQIYILMFSNDWICFSYPILEILGINSLIIMHLNSI